MFDAAQVDLQEDPSFFLDIKEQVQDICEEMGGRVDKIYVEQNSAGNVWVKYMRDNLEAAKKAVQMLNQKYFDSRQINAYFVPENVFSSKVKER